MKITIVLPTYNEAENLPRLIPALLALPIDLSLLIVDDNSPDGTGQIADDFAAQHPGRVSVEHRPGKGGLGPAYIHGFKRALEMDTDAIGQMDSDFSHPVDKVAELAKALETHEIASGSRYISGGSVDHNWPIWRKALSAGGNFYARTILRVPINDMTGGFRMYRRNVIEALPFDLIRSNGYIFQIETMYLLAKKLGFSVGEVPFYFADRQWGESKMNWRISMEAVWKVWGLLYLYRNFPPKN